MSTVITGTDITTDNVVANTGVDSPSVAISGSEVSPFGFRNFLINGDMRISQRGTSFTTTVANQYTLDRWFAGNAGAVVTQGLSGNSTVGNYLSYVTPSALPSHTARATQAIELPYYLSGKTITISFKLFTSSGLTSPFIQLWKGNTASIFTTSIATPSFVIPSINVWHDITITLTLPTIASDEHLTLAIRYAHTNGTQSDMLISKVQLEEGSVATPFEQRPIGLEDSLCRWYYEIVGSSVTSYASSAGNSRFGAAMSPKRTAPTIIKLVTLENVGITAEGSIAVQPYPYAYFTYVLSNDIAGKLLWHARYEVDAEI